MVKNRERSGKIRAVVSRLLAVLALVALFSWPGSAAIKRFTDEKGTLRITNEGAESAAQTSNFPPSGRATRMRGSGAFPGPGSVPPPPPQVAPSPPEHAPEEPEDAGQEVEEPPEEPAPGRRGR